MITDKQDVNNESSTPLLIVGAALSRTGTLSLKAALEQLGHKVFHGETFLSGRWPELFSALAEAHQKGRDGYHEIQEIIQKLSHEGYTATVDLPMAAIWKELHDAYPSATVLLTHRDSNLERWAHSFVSIATRLGFLFGQLPFRFFPPFSKTVNMQDWGVHRVGVPLDKIDKTLPTLITPETAIDMYHQYQQKVKDVVDPKQLVIFSVTEGWAPLCETVAILPCPENQPFPHVNQLGGGAASMLVTTMDIVTKTWPLLLALVIWLFCRVMLSLSRFIFNKRTAKGKTE